MAAPNDAGGTGEDHQYPHSPIHEAVCEFRFVPGAPWNATLPGLAYARLREDFPNVRTVREFSASISETDESIQHELVPHERIQFANTTETAIIVLGPNSVGASHLRPYPGWVSFKGLIERALAVYREIVDPAGIRRIGLRYINRVVIPGEQIDLAEYFDFYPHIGSGLPDYQVDFLSTVQFPFREYRDLLRLLVRGQPSASPDHRTVLLDLDYYVVDRDGVLFDDVGAWLEAAHAAVKRSFEGAVKEPLRRLFEEGVST